jgi:8-oxo-dGTP pyrophosphatase MutT (NUDIX family)
VSDPLGIRLSTLAAAGMRRDRTTLVTVIVVTDPLTGYVRVKVVCVFSNGGRILAIDAFDPTKDQRYWVPIGGRVEFGEKSRDAIVREVREELSGEVDNLRFLGVLENIFTYNGEDGHEIIFVYDGQFTDRSPYEEATVRGVESNGEEFSASWIDPTRPDHGWPLYPDGLTELLGRNRLLKPSYQRGRDTTSGSTPKANGYTFRGSAGSSSTTKAKPSTNNKSPGV